MDTPIYSPKAIEQDAQAYWKKKQSFNVVEDLGKEKFYCLSMFPYPSGSLHMGHVRNYTLGDVIARYQRHLGKNVLQPIGWDAFGLPAENAAIKHKVHPAEWTKSNIDAMREEFLQLGNAYDWRREFATCDEEYYRWEQWFFIKLYEKGLVYKKNSTVNWDPVDQTVLANEQVVDGRGWRSGALIERKDIAQWFIRITAYAEELLSGLDELDGWPEQVKTMQRNWIGRSEGANIHFKLSDQPTSLVVYTTRPDTLMGVSYLAIAAAHPLAIKAAENNPQLAAFIERCKTTQVAEAEMATMEKLGIDSGLTAIHPVSGKSVPIWVANFVLMHYGSGAVMSVPAHDQRDYEFASKYQLPILPVIKPCATASDLQGGAYTEPGELYNSAQFDGLSSGDAAIAITEYLKEHQLGEKAVNYRLRDWGVSRQRYWGTPIPMILCESCGAVPVKETDLPVTLPREVEFTGNGSPLAHCDSFVNTPCPKCEQPAKRETDTFDTFVESSWYYARFSCKNQDNAMLDDRAKYWAPVDQYIGGIEHAVMHLLYARFFHKLMRDFGLLNSNEPFKRLLTQGMVLKDGAKMSKSKGNVVCPTQLIEKYGADTARLFSMFAAPPEQSLEWSDAGVEGAFRFLNRIWSFSFEHPHLIETNSNISIEGHTQIDWQQASNEVRKVRSELHQLLTKALYDYERNQFNTVVSATMKMQNLLAKLDQNEPFAQRLSHEGLSFILRLLAPITPHICHHLWRALKFGEVIIDAPWPKVDKRALKLSVKPFVIQINGKLRAKLDVPAELDDEAIVALALTLDEVKKSLIDKSLRKSIVITKRQLVNLVIN